jgi:putative membrane protein
MRRVICTVAIALASAPAFAGSDVDFVEKAANASMLEVKLGQHAVKNAASPDVRAFGQRMIDDHGKASRELEALAQKEGVTVPTTLDAHHAKMAQELLAEAGPAFDRDYMKMMVEGHEDVVATFRAESKDGKTDIDRWAAQTLPTLESHLQQARDVEKRLPVSTSDATR